MCSDSVSPVFLLCSKLGPKNTAQTKEWTGVNGVKMFGNKSFRFKWHKLQTNTNFKFATIKN